MHICVENMEWKCFIIKNSTTIQIHLNLKWNWNKQNENNSSKIVTFDVLAWTQHAMYWVQVLVLWKKLNQIHIISAGWTAVIIRTRSGDAGCATVNPAAIRRKKTTNPHTPAQTSIKTSTAMFPKENKITQFSFIILLSPFIHFLCCSKKQHIRRWASIQQRGPWQIQRKVNIT